MGKEKSGVSTIASDCNLIDAHTARQNESATTATYARGSKKIDYVLITPELLPLIRRSGMLPFYTNVHSDHRGMYIDLDAKALFKGQIAELYSQPSRNLSSKFPKAVLKYKQELWKQLQAHNIPNRSEEIQRRSQLGDHNISVELNKIAYTIQSSMLLAESKCKKPPAPQYSEKIAALNKIIRYWKIIKSNMLTGRKVESIIEHLKTAIPRPMHHLLVKTNAVDTHIKQAVDNYRQAIPNATEL
jgi:hypothetical protein